MMAEVDRLNLIHRPELRPWHYSFSCAVITKAGSL